MRSLRLGSAEIRFTETSDGDFRPPAADEVRRHVNADSPWTWLRQVHGADVVLVEEAGDNAGASADAAVAVVRGAPVAVVTADCAPVVLVDDAGGSVAVAHAGWRGLHEGVISATVATMRARGAESISAALGPCIHVECYEFDGPELQSMVERFGTSVRGATSAGTPALDMPAAVRAALAASGVDLVEAVDECTACSSHYWSHRARKDEQRQATVAWLS